MPGDILFNLYLFATAQGVFLFFFIAFNKRIKKHKFFLLYYNTFFIVRNSTYILDSFAHLETINFLAMTMTDILFYFFGPVTLFYMENIFEHTGSKKAILYFLPPLPFFIPYAVYLTNPDRYFPLVLFCFYALSILTIIYLAFSYYKLIVYRRKLKPRRNDIYLFFILLLSIPLFFIIITIILEMWDLIFPQVNSPVDYIYYFLLNLTIVIFFLFITFKTPAFYHTKNKDTIAREEKNSAKKTADNKKYKLKLPGEESKAYASKVTAYLEESRSYMQQSYTLPDLSNALNIPLYKLSLVINDQLNTSFYHLINRYRIEEAKKLLLSMDQKKTNIVNIAFQSGFNSSSTFYSIFKKFTGMTPTEYIRQNRE